VDRLIERLRTVRRPRRIAEEQGFEGNSIGRARRAALKDRASPEANSLSYRRSLSDFPILISPKLIPASGRRVGQQKADCVEKVVVATGMKS
jgi:hypothetical protein